ncbi:hypothetical protein Pcinc_035593 [Petrolisthes cinctipes]|uniref:Uncharacterized protein n=1 Tax=Petrolisthes cinctipes TaxID=88211 RepID=A0AAE1BW94_PETCI|nr:hypothetical protein Pcinc_035593 [Petrolisthes cinctipes]
MQELEKNVSRHTYHRNVLPGFKPSSTTTYLKGGQGSSTISLRTYMKHLRCGYRHFQEGAGQVPWLPSQTNQEFRDRLHLITTSRLAATSNYLQAQHSEGWRRRCGLVSEIIEGAALPWP